jgi:hypothetical protein
MRVISILVVFVAVAGCTVVEVKPVERAVHDIQRVCIEQNVAVRPAGFLPMLEKSFNDHGIQTEVYQGKPSDSCTYTATYVAHWNWDIAVYMTDAEVVIRRGGEEVGRAVYHLRNKGGLDMGKWSSADSKMQPVLDKLLAGFEGTQLTSSDSSRGVTQAQYDKAEKCQSKGGVWVNDQCVVRVE